MIHGFAFDAVEYWLDFNSDIYIVETAASGGTTWRALTENRLSRAPTFSPDGSRIAFLQQPTLFSSNDVYVVRADGTNFVRVTKTSGAYSTPRWSPDGLRLTFSNWSIEQTNGVYASNADVFVVNADGTGLKNVSQHVAYDTDPSWSPDGRYIVFISSRAGSPGNFRQDVFVMDADGIRPPTRLTQLPVPSATPTWSPDGRRILFTSAASVFVMNADGSSIVRLTTPPELAVDVSPAWKR